MKLRHTLVCLTLVACADQAQLLGTPVDLTPAMEEIGRGLDTALAPDSVALGVLGPHNGSITGMDTCRFANGAMLATWNYEYGSIVPEVPLSFVLKTDGSILPLDVVLPLQGCIAIGERLAIINSCGALLVDPEAGVVTNPSVSAGSCGYWPNVGRAAAADTYLRVTDVYSSWIQAYKFTIDAAGQIGTATDTSSIHIPLPADAGDAVLLWVKEASEGQYYAVWTNDTGQVYRTEPSGAATAIPDLIFARPTEVLVDELFDRRSARPEAAQPQADDTLRLDLTFGTDNSLVVVFEPVSATVTFLNPSIDFSNGFSRFGEPFALGAQMARTAIANPYDATLEIPTGFEARGFYLDSPATLAVPLTPCTDRDACREVGESELLAVIGWEAGIPTAFYQFWAWRLEGTAKGGKPNGGGGASDRVYGIFARPVPLP